MSREREAKPLDKHSVAKSLGLLQDISRNGTLVAGNVAVGLHEFTGLHLSLGGSGIMPQIIYSTSDLCAGVEAFKRIHRTNPFATGQFIGTAGNRVADLDNTPGICNSFLERAVEGDIPSLNPLEGNTAPESQQPYLARLIHSLEGELGMPSRFNQEIRLLYSYPSAWDKIPRVGEKNVTLQPEQYPDPTYKDGEVAEWVDKTAENVLELLHDGGIVYTAKSKDPHEKRLFIPFHDFEENTRGNFFNYLNLRKPITAVLGNDVTTLKQLKLLPEGVDPSALYVVAPNAYSYLRRKDDGSIHFISPQKEMYAGEHTDDGGNGHRALVMLAQAVELPPNFSRIIPESVLFDPKINRHSPAQRPIRVSPKDANDNPFLNSLLSDIAAANDIDRHPTGNEPFLYELSAGQLEDVLCEKFRSGDIRSSRYWRSGGAGFAVAYGGALAAAITGHHIPIAGILEAATDVSLGLGISVTLNRGIKRRQEKKLNFGDLTKDEVMYEAKRRGYGIISNDYSSRKVKISYS